MAWQGRWRLLRNSGTVVYVRGVGVRKVVGKV